MKLREYCVDPFVRGVRDAEYQLYWAVVEGNIRARHKGRELTREGAYALREKRWSDLEDDHYALLPDIELSVEDAERIWGSSQCPLPESLTRALDAGNASAQPEGRRPERQHRPRGRPTRERVQGAIAALYPNGVPDQVAVSNKQLCGAVSGWLKERGLTDISDDTILRAAGRRK